MIPKEKGGDAGFRTAEQAVDWSAIRLARMPESDGALRMLFPQPIGSTPSGRKPPFATSREQAQVLGQWAERAAVLAYRREGFVVVGRNLRRASGEVDLLVERAHQRYAVEVKFRSDFGLTHGTGLTAQKLQRTCTAISRLNCESSHAIQGVEALVLVPETIRIWRLYRYDWFLGDLLQWSSHPLMLETSQSDKREHDSAVREMGG